MLNQLYLVGRIKKIEIKEVDILNLTLEVQKSYQNKEGEYESDYIDVTLYSNIAKNSKDYIHENDLVGIRGRLAQEVNRPLRIEVEKVTFLSSNRTQNNMGKGEI